MRYSLAAIDPLAFVSLPRARVIRYARVSARIRDKLGKLHWQYPNAKMRERSTASLHSFNCESLSGALMDCPRGEQWTH